jgi:hypothetical protein
MTFKVANISDPGTSTRHGADDQDKIARYLNGEDLIDPVIIDTDTIYKSNKIIFRDLSDSFNINIITSAETQSGSITIPTLDGNVTLLLDNDTRLYDPRTPVAHSLTHQSGQADVIPIDQLGEATDNLLLNASSTAHGLLPKLSVDGLTYLDGNGNWTSPSGTGILVDGSITTAKLADDAIDANKLADGVVIDAHIAPAAAIAYSKLALTGAILNADINTSAAIAWSKISKTGSKLEDLADVNITGRSDQMLIKWDATTSKYVFYSPGVGGGAVIPDDNSVSAAKIQSDAVTTIKILNANVTTAKIAALNITTALIADGNVTLAKLATASVDSSKIVDGSIVNADVNTSAAIAWTKVSKSGSVLADIGNVSVAGATTGQVLTLSGSTWVASTPSVGSSGSVSPVSPNKKWGIILGGASVSTGGTVGSGMCSGWNTRALTSGNTTEGIDSDGAYIALNTTSTSQTNAQIDSDHANVFRGSLGFKIWTLVKFNNVNNNRWFIGVTDTIGLAENTYNFLNSNIGFALRYDTTTDSTLQLIYNNNTSTQDVQDTSITPAANTLYLVTIEYTGSNMILTVNGTSFTKSSNIPPTTQGLGWVQRMQNSSGSVRTMQVYYVYVEQG